MATDVTEWLLDGDPAIRWQVLRDLTDASHADVAAERARITETGWGARLLDLQEDGQWAGGACFPGNGWTPPASVVGDRDAQPWVATLPTLRLLLAFGADPADPRVRTAVQAAADNARWEYDGSPFFDGEVEPCINGGTVSIGASFGQPVDGIVTRLLRERLPDGGWNCEAENGSTRSSFHTTICVLEGLWEYARAGGSIDVTAARQAGEEYLLERGLLRRLSTGEVVDTDFLLPAFPPHWHYDVLRALDHFRDTGAAPDPRLAEALDLIRSKQAADGTWLLENLHAGMQWFALDDGVGRPSRWNTLRALRVLRWADA